VAGVSRQVREQLLAGGDYTSDKALYDACLELNTIHGAGSPVSLLPVNMVYGECDQDLY
jgi:hypothetical protein